MSTHDTASLPQFPGENFLSHAAAIFQEQVEARFAELGWLASAQGLQSEEVKAIVDAGCAAVGLRCTEDELAAHNSEVDSCDEVRALMLSVGANANGLCRTQWSHEPAMPEWNHLGGDYFPTNNHTDHSCSAVPTQTGQKKHRLCYCHP